VDFRNRLARRKIGLDQVRAALPEGTTLVGYAQYSQISRDPQAQPKLSYMAFILRPRASAPIAVPLGDAEGIHPLVEAWRNEAAFAPQGLLLADGTSEARYREQGEKLRKAIWDCVEHEAKGSRLVLIVPDAELHLVSFATLPIGKDQYLVERAPLIHYLSTERDLVVAPGGSRPGSGLLAVGGPDFDSQTAARVADATTVPTLRGAAPSCSDIRKVKLEPLPGSLTEVDEVEALWMESAARRTGGQDARGAVLKLTGAMADEAAIKARSPGHRVLHFATHGLFARLDRCSSMIEDARSRVRHGLRSGLERPPPPNPTSSSPLDLSGLALAGANLRNGSDGESEDGVLTAEEISTMNLTDVEWAVLSACDTGLGKVVTGEGVLGLRRAFEVAGARTLIMSLWSMEDESTRLWMRGLYHHRLRGLSTAEAVRRASLESIAERRSRGKSTHPFFWGCFVAAGAWK